MGEYRSIKKIVHFYLVFSIRHLVLLGLIKNILVVGGQGFFQIDKHGIGVLQGCKRVGWNSMVNSFIDSNNSSMY